MSKFHKIILCPSITEKNTLLREENKYVFEVLRTATKQDIKAAVENLFSVKVEAVNTMVVGGKFKRMGKSAGYKSDWKKAIVKLAEGQTIEKLSEV